MNVLIRITHHFGPSTRPHFRGIANGRAPMLVLTLECYGQNQQKLLVHRALQLVPKNGRMFDSKPSSVVIIPALRISATEGILKNIMKTTESISNDEYCFLFAIPKI